MRSLSNPFSLITAAALAAILALPACSDDNSDGGPTPVNTGGSMNNIEGVPLAFMNGWLNADANDLGVQGAVFAYADTHTGETMMENIAENGAQACITGTASKVDTTCTPSDPTMDCYGEYWGAAIGFNLNQPVDPATNEGGDPMPFDGSSITAFSFELTGPTVPTSMRFSVETSTGDHCTLPSAMIKAGVNTIELSSLVTECWTNGDQKPIADKNSMLKIAWGVVTNSSSATPFDFCVSNVIAVQ